MIGRAVTSNLSDVAGTARDVPESERRWQVLAHLREPQRVPGMMTRTLVGGVTVAVAPLGSAGEPAPVDPLPLDAIRVLSREDLPTWVERFRSAAIQADRYTSPNLLAQLDQAARRPIDSVVCNALDPDPLTDLQSQLALEHPDALHAGVLALMRLLGARQGLICISTSFPTTRSLLPQSAVDGVVEPLVRRLEHTYPISHPSLLLLDQLRLRLAPGQLPTSVGVLLLDAAAAVAVGRLLLTGAAMTRVSLLVSTDAGRRSVLVRAPVGCELRALLQSAGVSCEGARLFAGAVLRRRAANLAEIVGPGEQVVHVAPAPEFVMPTACTRCGWCADVCPVRALPAGLLEAAQQRDLQLADRAGLDACIECGLCDQVCPSRLPILGSIQQLRRSLANMTGGHR